MPNLGLVQVKVGCRHGRSVVTEQFGQAPLQVHRPLYLEKADFPVMYLRSPSAGLLDGDIHKIEILVERGAGFELRTQAASLVYPGRSQVEIAVKVEEGASFVFMPHPLILGAGASLKQRIRIDLAGNASLCYQDNWCAGRIGMNERWRFTSFDNSLLICCDGRVVYRERWHLEPERVTYAHPLLCDKFTHFKSSYTFGAMFEMPEERFETGSSLGWTLSSPLGKIRRVASV